jgi:hypothetical protein
MNKPKTFPRVIHKDTGDEYFFDESKKELRCVEDPSDVIKLEPWEINYYRVEVINAHKWEMWCPLLEAFKEVLQIDLDQCPDSRNIQSEDMARYQKLIKEAERNPNESQATEF